MSSQLGPSEFEGTGPARSGVFAKAHEAFLSAAEKLRLIHRTEQDPDSPPIDMDATPDKWKHGGVNSVTDIDFRS